MNRLTLLVIRLIISLAVGLVIFFGWRWFESNRYQESIENSDQIDITDPQLPILDDLSGGDVDENGCVISTGFYWCEEKQKCLQDREEYCGPAIDDDVFAVLKNIRQRVMGFGNSQSASFSWLTPSASLNLSSGGDLVIGIKINGPNFSVSEQDRVIRYLEAAGFAENKFNSITEPDGYARGFFKDSIVCIIKSEKTEKNRAEQQVMEISCGHLNREIPAFSLTEQEMKASLAKKYSKSEQEVSVRVSHEDATHVRGVVEFAPGGPENTGMFLAIKEAGKWIAFDGNGVPDCETLKAANFPTSMLEDICD